MPKTRTINLGKGGQVIEYAKVSSRVGEFHKLYKTPAITTTFEFKEGVAIFKATVTPDVNKPERQFTGTSLGKAGAVKAFEKLETIAVGRALAFAGLLSDGEIASSEEMQSYAEATPAIDITKAMEKLNAAKTKGELGKTWALLSQAERENKEVQSLKDSLKAKYDENSPSGTEKPGLVSTPQGEDNGDGAKENSGDEASKGELPLRNTGRKTVR